jgi:hypothetical protein
MYFGTPIDLGFGFKSFFKKVGHGVAKGARAAERGAVKGTKAAGRGAARVSKKTGLTRVGKVAFKAGVLPLRVMALGLELAFKVATRPIRSRLNTLKDRRARKLAWDRRRATTPTVAERAEARAWAKHMLNHEYRPLGYMLAYLSGADPAAGALGDAAFGAFGEPITASILASIPVLIGLSTTVLNKTVANKQAPINPQGTSPTAPARPLPPRRRRADRSPIPKPPAMAAMTTMMAATMTPTPKEH